MSTSARFDRCNEVAPRRWRHYSKGMAGAPASLEKQKLNQAIVG